MKYKMKLLKRHSLVQNQDDCVYAVKWKRNPKCLVDAEAAVSKRSVSLGCPGVLFLQEQKVYVLNIQ